MKLPEKIKPQTITAGGTGGVPSLVQSFLSVEDSRINEIIDYLEDLKEQVRRLQEEDAVLAQKISKLNDRIQTIANNQLEMKRGDRMITVTVPTDTPKRWRAEKSEEYFYVDSHGVIYNDLEAHMKQDNFRYAIGNYFKTEKGARAYKEKLLEMGRNSN